jgi:hypothetical protein
MVRQSENVLENDRSQFPMEPINLNLIQEIYHLWEPVYPYLGQQIHELYNRQDGNILEIGPFSGVIFNLQKRNIGSSFLIATFPSEMGNYFQEEAIKQKVNDKIRVIGTDPALTGIEENSIDLAVFRGAFFFPSLFKVNFSVIYRILKTNGIAFIGGGFGKFTPNSVIKQIGKRSRELNLQIGKIEISEDRLRQDIQIEGIEGEIKIISEGGLWVLMNK